MLKQISCEGNKHIRQKIEKDLHYLIIKLLMEFNDKNLIDEQIAPIIKVVYLNQYYIESMKKNNLDTYLDLSDGFYYFSAWEKFYLVFNNEDEVFSSINYITKNSIMIMRKYQNRNLPNDLLKNYYKEPFSEIYCNQDRYDILTKLAHEYKVASN